MPKMAMAPARAAALPNYTPSSVLCDDAGHYAEVIAHVWPRPHTAYFEADRARRRLAMLVAYAETGNRGALAEPLAVWSLKRIAAAHLPNAPAGLVEALRKLSAERWSRPELEMLMKLLGESPAAVKVLRHSAEITIERVRILSSLQEEIIRMQIVGLLPNAAVARHLANGARLVSERGGDRALHALVERLDRARSTGSLFRMLIEAIGLERLAPPPIPGTDWLVPLATVGALTSAGRRFENCLRYRIPALLSGQAAYYEVLGREPAVVEIVRDGHGLWTVGEVRGHANVAISAQLWGEVRAHLEAHGTRTTRHALDAYAHALAVLAEWADA